LALFLAWIVARTDTPYRESLEVMITLPFYIPADPHHDGVGHAGHPQGWPAQPGLHGTDRPARAANRSWLEVGTGTVNVEAPSDQAAAPGAILTLSVDAVHTWAVRG
jgi:ABC-type Fe3+ transport system permease subunit